jgi:DUF438 domain-containing protein
MSELINNSERRKELLKHLILQLHDGKAPEEVRQSLTRLLGQVPYHEVVEVEQELIDGGLPVGEVLKLCDVHGAALKGQIDTSAAKPVPPGHPVDVFRQENRALEWELEAVRADLRALDAVAAGADASEAWGRIRGHLNALWDVDKHYARKENLLFPYLEKRGITGPPTVMWGKHDEARALLKAALAAPSVGTIAPALEAIEGMIDKEEQILLPMCLDKLDEGEWGHIARHTNELGYCLVVPATPWQPAGAVDAEAATDTGRVQLPSGSFTPEELTSILNTIPFDLTFVDRDDTVRYFTEGRERIFARTRAIVGRDVKLCHPPSSVHVVERILADFKAGRQERAAFWIPMHGRFLSIEYFALRGPDGSYLGTLEVSQDLTEKRALEGERRILAYDSEA